MGSLTLLQGIFPTQGSNPGLLHCKQTLCHLTHKGSPGGDQCRKPQFNSGVRKICWRRDRLLTPVFLGFPCGSAGKESTCSVGDLGLIPGLGRSPGEGKGYPLQYYDLENSTDCIVHWVAKSRTRLSDFTHSLLHCRQVLYQQNYQGSPSVLIHVYQIW